MSIYISNSLYLSASGGDYNSNNPIIGYNSVLTPDDITIDQSVSVRPAANAWTPDTSVVWEGEAHDDGPFEFTQYLVLANPNGYTVDYIGLARHNFGSAGLTVKIQYSDDGVTWLDLTVDETPTDDSAIIFYFDATSSSRFRVNISKYAVEVDAPIVGHVKLGSVLVLQRRIYVGHMPATLSRKVKRSTYGSENGQYLGQIIERTYLTTSIDQENNTPAFVRSDIVPFIDHVNGQVSINNTAPATFFFAWRPSDYPLEVVYGWTRDNIQPENQGGDQMGGRMSWSCSVEAIA